MHADALLEAAEALRAAGAGRGRSAGRRGGGDRGTTRVRRRAARADEAQRSLDGVGTGRSPPFERTSRALLSGPSRREANVLPPSPTSGATGRVRAGSPEHRPRAGTERRGCVGPPAREGDGQRGASGAGQRDPEVAHGKRREDGTGRPRRGRCRRRSPSRRRPQSDETQPRTASRSCGHRSRRPSARPRRRRTLCQTGEQRGQKTRLHAVEPPPEELGTVALRRDALLRCREPAAQLNRRRRGRRARGTHATPWRRRFPRVSRSGSPGRFRVRSTVNCVRWNSSCATVP